LTWRDPGPTETAGCLPPPRARPPIRGGQAWRERGPGPASFLGYQHAPLAISPVVLGRGAPLLAGLDLARLGYRCTEHVATADAMHVALSR